MVVVGNVGKIWWPSSTGGPDRPALTYMKEYIPKIYSWGKRTVLNWNQDIYYGLVLEWVENAEWLFTQNIAVRHAVSLVAGLSRMHELGVSHNDKFAQNLLVVRQPERALWIDFSCAYFDERETHPQHTEGLVGEIVDKVPQISSWLC